MDVKKKEKVLAFIDKYIMLLPIIFAIAVIPLIVRVAYHETYLENYGWFTKQDKVTDLYVYYKHIAMIVLDGILLVGYIYLALRRKLLVNLGFLPLFVYFMLISFSAAFSISPNHTWNGFFGMMESAYVLFGYCLICYYTFTVIRTEKQLKLVLGIFAISTVILGLIAVSQFIEMDFYDTELGKYLIFPEEFAMYKDSMRKNTSVGAVSVSLYNQNYVGVYTCLLFPILFIFLFSAKSKLQMVAGTVLMGFIMVCLVGSKSQAAMLALTPGILCMVFCFAKKYWKSMIVVSVICGVMLTGLSMYQGDRNIVSDTMDVIVADNDWGEPPLISDITLNDEDFKIVYNDDVLTFRYYRDENTFLGLRAYDSDGTELEVALNEKRSGYILTDERYADLEFIFARDAYSNPGYLVTSEGNSWFVYYSEINRTYLYMNVFGKATKLISSETFYSPVFELMGGFSGRDFIWAKSIPILKETLLIGSGPDTFSFMFPQYDYVDLIQRGCEGILLTKPHSLYLQIGIQTGVISLVMFLLFNAIYCLQSVKLFYKRSLNTWIERIGAGIFIADICYLIVMLINDSTIGVSIIYWTLLGMGYACNRMILNPEEDKTEDNEEELLECSLEEFEKVIIEEVAE